MKIGEPVDSVLIGEDVARLKRLPAVAHADYKIIASPKGYILEYYVDENFTLIPSLSLYTTTDDEFAYRVGVNEFNLFGQNIGLGGFYQRDIFDSYGLAFRAPFLFSKKLGLGVFYQNLTTQEPVFFDNTTADYSYNNHSLEVLAMQH